MSPVTSPKLQENPPFLSLYQRGTGRFPHPLHAFPSPCPWLKPSLQEVPPLLTSPLSQMHCLQMFPKNAL